MNCKKCLSKVERKRGHKITNEVHCYNCEGYESCKHWLWGGKDLSDLRKNAEDCQHFAIAGSHKHSTCRRGFFTL